jgi:prenyltransferase beta subunit
MFRKLLLLSYCLFFTVGLGQGMVSGSRKTEVLKYIYTKLQKSDRGFGWEDQPDGHLTPTFAAVGILHYLNQLPEEKSTIIKFVLSRHPQTGINKEAGPSGSELRNLVYQQIQALLWLGDDARAFVPIVEKWKSQTGNIYNYEKAGNPVFMQEMMTPVCRSLLRMHQSEGFSSYLKDRRRKNGSFNNLPARDGGDGNIINTYWGVFAMNILSTKDSLRRETLKWIQDCQRGNGGFTHQPDPSIGANDDVAYTWAAVKTLRLLNGQPRNRQACIEYLLSLQNFDGGFGNQPGFPSTPMATFYAIESLRILGALRELEKSKKIIAVSTQSELDLSEYKIYTVQFQAHGTGSPSEAVMLANNLGIHLWGAKNASKDWIETAQKIADDRKIPVKFFHSNEDYGRYIQIDGMGSFSHLLDPIFPASSLFSPNQDLYNWDQLKNDYLKPLLNDKGALIFQVSNNEPLTRILLDESARSGAFAGISTFHFGQNFLFFLPHLYEYRYRIPFVSLQDAHGPEVWWWINELIGYRTLFLAKEPTYEELMKALRNNLVVAVRHDAVTGFKTRVLGGAPGVQQHILTNKQQWQWWSDDGNELIHPKAVVTIIKPGDKHESTRPDQGVYIRVRCWWNSNRQVLREPLVKLERLLVNGIEVEPEYVQITNNRGQIMDSFFIYHIPQPLNTEYEIKAVIRELENGNMKTITEKFVYSDNI